MPVQISEILRWFVWEKVAGWQLRLVIQQLFPTQIILPFLIFKLPPNAINVLIDGCNIQSLIDLKLLGVTVNNKMTFSTHIRDVCKKTSMKIGARLRLRNLIPVDAKLQLYKAATSSDHLTCMYCHTVRLFCRASDSKKLERLQEHALRAVFFDKSTMYIWTSFSRGQIIK